MTLRDPRDSALSNAHYVSGRRDEDPNEVSETDRQCRRHGPFRINPPPPPPPRSFPAWPPHAAYPGCVLGVTMTEPSRSRVGRFSSPRHFAVQYIMTVGCRDYITSIALFYYWQSEVQGGVYPTLPIWYRE